MEEKLTIQLAVEQFDLYELFNEIIDSYTDDLEDPSVSDLYDLIEEYDEEFDFYPDDKGDYSASFERNLREAIAAIIEMEEDLSFVDDEFEEDQVPEIYGDEFESDNDRFGLDIDEDEEFYED